MILKTNKAKVSLTQKDLSKAFKGADYEGIEFVFKNLTITQEIEFAKLHEEISKQSEADKGNDDMKVGGVSLLIQLISKIFKDCLVEVKGFKDEEGNDLSVSDQFITDLIDYNYELAFEVGQTYLTLRNADKKK